MEHRPTGDRVENLVQVALHAGTLARGENDGGEFAFLDHGQRLATIRLRFEVASFTAARMAKFPFDTVAFDLTERCSTASAIWARR